VAQSDLVDWLRPDAGALCCFRLKPEAFDGAAVERFYTALAEEGVRVANGTWFGEEQRVFRLGFGLLTMPDLEAGLTGLTAALQLACKEAA
jgi:DNA-binding transcriptional MocR family regulator